MTANLSTRRPDDYGPVEPWRHVKITDADVKDRIAKLVTAGVLAADFTPDPIDNAVYGSLKLILDEPKVRRSIRAVAEALPQHRPAVVQQLFAEGM